MASKRNSNSEPKLILARNREGRIVSIDEVPNGNKCGCTCAACGKPLIARQGEKNQHHFAHEGGNIIECIDKTKHAFAEQIIKDNLKVYSPKYEKTYKHASELLLFVNVEVEERRDYSDLQPDLVGITDDGKRIYIEILNTHAVDEKKEQKIIDRELICMEINISQCSEDELETFLLTTDDNRRWINHPEYDKRDEEEQARIDNYYKEEIRKMDSQGDWYEDSDVENNDIPYNPHRYYTEPGESKEDEPKPVIINDAEPPAIVPNKALDPIIEKLRKERIVKDGNGNTYHVDLCEQTYDGKYIVARVFDENYKTSHQAAHIVLINSLGTISYDFGNESGENLYSWRYTYAKRFK